ncbi:tetratricopeptide repeat protein [Haloferula rosea]|uniref:Tetratricopeptide repeat protein n=1 Tax=Haloferula rosea TaxID=490093 RepID=A0A934R8M9_9BACT|nr:tetratricopeptide repeat protein [Haloferula rosea]MBK1827264.1 tetratricopeptide repeat protein [Haloferula rosea]
MSLSSIQFLLSRNRPEEAERVARGLLAKDPEDLSILFFLGVALLDQNKPKQAEEVFRDIIGQAPEFTDAYFMLARCLSERSRHKEALKAIGTAIESDPDDATYHGLKASILFQLNKPTEALQSAETGLALDPDDDSCRFYKSILLGQVGRHEEADAEAHTLLADDPDEATSHCARGWVKQLAGDAQAAEQHFIEALRIDPGHEDARIGLAESLKMGNPLLGWLMRGLLWMGRVPWYYLLAGILAASMTGRFLRKFEDPLPLLLGKGVQGLLMLLFMVMICYVPLFNLALASSRKGRLALSDDEKTGLKWAVVPLVAGFVFLVIWVMGGLKSMPFLAIACFSVASLISEVMETTRAQVRRSMKAIALVAAGVAAYLFVFYFTYFPAMVAELLVDATISASKEGTSPGNNAELLSETMQEVITLRKRFIDYPTLSLLIAAGFRVDIREFFERRSSDAID